jgi:hypothetical protein
METFVIQIPTQTDDTGQTGPDDLRGVVEHVGSGKRRSFAGTPELVRFLTAEHRDLPNKVER